MAARPTSRQQEEWRYISRWQQQEMTLQLPTDDDKKDDVTASGDNREDEVQLYLEEKEELRWYANQWIFRLHYLFIVLLYADLAAPLLFTLQTQMLNKIILCWIFIP